MRRTSAFGGPQDTAAILDRLMHYCHTLLIQGESYRLKQKRRAGIFGAQAKG